MEDHSRNTDGMLDNQILRPTFQDWIFFLGIRIY